MQKVYEEKFQDSVYQGYVTLVVHTQARQKKCIYDSGCGPGTNSLIFAKSMLKKGGIYVGSDISEEMVKSFSQKFIDSEYEYSSIEGNRYFSLARDLNNTKDIDIQ